MALFNKQLFISGLKSKNSVVKSKAVKMLQQFVKTELREMTPEELTAFMDDSHREIYELVSSTDMNDKIAGLLVIICLIDADAGNTHNRISRFAFYLRNILPSNDIDVTILAAKTVGRIALFSGSYSSLFVAYELKTAFEWLSLSGDRNENKRHTAVLILRELCKAVPTYFYQEVQQFFQTIFNAIYDSKSQIRESAAKALRAAFAVTSIRENAKQSPNPEWYYKQCYDEAIKGLDELWCREKGLNKEDCAHGSLLVFNELLRVSNFKWETFFEEMSNKLMLKSLCETTLTDSSNIIPQLKLTIFEKTRKTSFTSERSFAEEVDVQVGLAESLHESASCRSLLDENFSHLCQIILAQKSSRSTVQLLPEILPRLAAFNSKHFASEHLNGTMSFLLTCLRGREREKTAAFVTIGFISVAIGKDMRTHLPKIMEVINLSLPSSRDAIGKKRLQTIEPTIFTCVTLLGYAMKENFEADIVEILEPMLSNGLSVPLTIALKELADCMPSIKPNISEGLLRILSVVLLNKQILAGYNFDCLPPEETIVRPPVTMDVPDSETGTVILALRTLGTFHFDARHLSQFVGRCANKFLTSEVREIRMEAISTFTIALRAIIESPYKRESRMLIARVLEKLLTIGVTDTDCDVRVSVFKSMTECFYEYLAQVEYLDAIYIALHDENSEIREISLTLLGRLSDINPGYILPSLRKILLHVLTELEHSGTARNKEQGARKLDNLARNAPLFLEPYIPPIFRILVPKLKEPTSGVVLGILKCVGDLCAVNGEEMKQWLKELLPILMEMLVDASLPDKRKVALWVFGQLVESTGCVVEPYNKYPHLLDILLNFLKTEQQPAIRREALKVLGLLGALDPYRRKLNLGQIDAAAVLCMGELKPDTEEEVAINEMLVNLSSSSLEEYYPAVVITTLMKILRDPTLSAHHRIVVQAIVFVFQSMGVNCVQYIQRVLPSLLIVIRSADVNVREFLVQQLAQLIAVAKQHVRNHLDDIFSLIKEYWVPGSPLSGTIIKLTEQVAIALGGEFKVYIPEILPQILKVFSHDSSKDRMDTMKMLFALQKFGNILEEFVHLILPPMVKLFDGADVPVKVSGTAMQTVTYLADILDFTDYSSRIIHPIVRCLETNPKLRDQAMETLCTIVVKLGKRFKMFIPLVNRTMSKNSIVHSDYELLIGAITSDQNIDFDSDPTFLKYRKGLHRKGDVTVTLPEVPVTKKMHFAANDLKSTWTANQRVSKDDWTEWLKRLSIGLLKASPAPALRSCYPLAETYAPLSRDLFNAAFVSCWVVLPQNFQNELTRTLQQALIVPDLPEITQTVLNLAEFMEHCEKGPLPLDPLLLGDRAMYCRAYAKALYYKESEFRKNQNSNVIEALISINNKLQQKEAAAGLLAFVMNHDGEAIKVQERWYEKLNRWETALDLYKTRLAEMPDDLELSLGQMRCLEGLGKWVDLDKTVSDHWVVVPESGREKMARMASAASWRLSKWANMEEYVNCIPQDTTDGSFYRAVLATHNNEYSVAQSFIDSARALLDTELAAMAAESYQRAYSSMVCVHMLAELEEVIQYKQKPERRQAIMKIWWERLQGCQKVVDDWQKILQVRTLVITPQEDMHTWLKYASLCRKSAKLQQSQKTLKMLLRVDPSVTDEKPISIAYPQVTLAYCKHLWQDGKRFEAHNRLREFVGKFLQCPGIFFGPDSNYSPQDVRRKFLARCYLKMGEWQASLQGVNENSIKTTMLYYNEAIEHHGRWYKAWHAWAYMNFEAAAFYRQRYEGSQDADTSRMINYAVPAVTGFFKSISLCGRDSLQDTLRLLTLWFDYGQYREVYEALVEGLKSMEIITWLQVIPQLIARIDTQRVLVGSLIHQLLVDIGKQHAQALVYPLTVASKSASPSRRSAAAKILNNICDRNQTLVQQAVMVSEELVRVAILWHEVWHDGLEEASRQYFGEKNVKAMHETLDRLHATLERGPQTLKETSFFQAHGRDLSEANEWCQRFKISGNVRDLNQAWDLYYHVFRRLTRQLASLTSLELQYISPKLLMCRDLELAVPGSYVPGQPVIRISFIKGTLQVITSKQRPRKLCLKGSNGSDYMFLLKGHEDLRLDERVMQLFSLLNTILLNDPNTFRHNLAIQRYAVVPLSTNSGLIGWVPHSDTLHGLIKDYRERKNILLNVEHRIMLRVIGVPVPPDSQHFSPSKYAQDYDHLSLMEKVEVFEHALENTPGDDLAKLMWLKSPSSEVWFDRRTNYTRSLAVMSMVGYVLGLGDRHPSNLMLDRLSGKVLHIDFGDCFEVATTREKFPEKIPFRLTRMLINAMEVTGIEGTYRKTCESVMSVLRRNKDSLMAVLEAFAYDPLINWRLIEGNGGAGGVLLSSTNAVKSDDPISDDLITISVSSISSPSSSINSPDPMADPRNVPLKKLSPECSGNTQHPPDILNKKALDIIKRVREKLTGHDFDTEVGVAVEKQVELLIHSATSHENLCQCYIGWCPFW